MDAKWEGVRSISSRQLPRISLLHESENGLILVVTSSAVIGEGILGERSAFELKLMVGMNAMLLRIRRAQRHNVSKLYWNWGGVRPLTIVDNADVSER